MSTTMKHYDGSSSKSLSLGRLIGIAKRDAKAQGVFISLPSSQALDALAQIDNLSRCTFVEFMATGHLLASFIFRCNKWILALSPDKDARKAFITHITQDPSPQPEQVDVSDLYQYFLNLTPKCVLDSLKPVKPLFRGLDSSESSRQMLLTFGDFNYRGRQYHLRSTGEVEGIVKCLNCKGKEVTISLQNWLKFASPTVQ